MLARRVFTRSCAFYKSLHHLYLTWYGLIGVNSLVYIKLPDLFLGTDYGVDVSLADVTLVLSSSGTFPRILI